MKNNRRWELINKKILGELTKEEAAELAALEESPVKKKVNYIRKIKPGEARSDDRE